MVNNLVSFATVLHSGFAFFFKSLMFLQTGTHQNTTVAMYAIDSLRQLAFKFLEKEELANYNFQMEFFKPFETIMASKAGGTQIRELVFHPKFLFSNNL